MAKCASCGKGKAKGSPPTCGSCYSRHLFEEAERGFLAQLVEHPVVKEAVGKLSGAASSAIDKGVERIVGQMNQYAQIAMQGVAARAARPKKPASPQMDARVVMGFSPSETLSKDKIKQRKRELAKIFHSDVGGSDDAMRRLNQAADELLKQV